MVQYEVRYEDEKGRYTEETFGGQVLANVRAMKLAGKGIEVEVWEVGRGPERRIDNDED